jgi:hypothetical protein
MQLSNGITHFADEQHAAEDSYHHDIEMECAHLEEEQDTQKDLYGK